MRISPSHKIYSSASLLPNAGRGVFAAIPIKKDEHIESCPLVFVKELEVTYLKRTELLNYYFQWGEEDSYHKAAICLGFGSLYNHSFTPNATYVKRYEDDVIDFIALKNISINEEIAVNYNHGDPNNKTNLWISTIPKA